MLTTRSLNYFQEVARRGSIRRASEHLNIASSAVDRQIIQLETYLGVPLFDRHPRGLTLTSAGEVLLVATREANRNLNEAKRHIDDLQGLRRGEILIAAIEGAHGLISRPLAQFQRDYPAISHRVLVADARKVAEMVMTNEYDIGITFTSPTSQSVHIERQLLYQFEAVVTPDHPFAQQKQVSIHECEQFPVLVPAQPISLRTLIDEFWMKHSGSNISPAIEATSLSLLKSMIPAMSGIGLLTPVDVIEEVEKGLLVCVPFKEQPPMSILSLVTSSSRTMSRGASELLKRISAEMARQDAPEI
jgi:DNA-binding transcriptional LysR family regulator